MDKQKEVIETSWKKMVEDFLSDVRENVELVPDEDVVLSDANWIRYRDIYITWNKNSEKGMTSLVDIVIFTRHFFDCFKKYAEINGIK